MQNITQPTEPTNTTEQRTAEPQHTLADYLTARAEELRQKEEREAQQEQERQQRTRENLLRSFVQDIEAHITPGLRRALDLSPAGWVEVEEVQSASTWKHELPGMTFTLDGEDWAITHNGGWAYIDGPNHYRCRLWDERTTDGRYIYNRSILDAIRGYPEWVEQRRLQDEAEAQYRAEEEAAAADRAISEKEAQQEPARYTAIMGLGSNCLLRKGAYVTVYFAHYYGAEDETANYGLNTIGTVEAWDKRWLLLTDAQGWQQLINWRHVALIEPCAKAEERRLEQSATADADAESAAATAANDLEEIPF